MEKKMERMEQISFFLLYPLEWHSSVTMLLGNNKLRISICVSVCVCVSSFTNVQMCVLRPLWDGKSSSWRRCAEGQPFFLLFQASLFALMRIHSQINSQVVGCTAELTLITYCLSHLLKPLCVAGLPACHFDGFHHSGETEKSAHFEITQRRAALFLKNSVVFRDREADKSLKQVPLPCIAYSLTKALLPFTKF